VLPGGGDVAARLVPGERTALLVELPPLRLPQASNVILKTLTRLEWYIKEVLPLFLFGTALMFTLDRLGWLGGIIRLGEPLVTGWLGLPAEASAAFRMGCAATWRTGLFVGISACSARCKWSSPWSPSHCSSLASLRRIARSGLAHGSGMVVLITPWHSDRRALSFAKFGRLDRMSTQPHRLTCSMCGHQFDPAGQAACQACPAPRLFAGTLPGLRL
jgi:hypothetical protein